MKRIDLVVIGAGPAGIAAAVTAARLELTVALLDEGTSTGGQVLGYAHSDQHAAVPGAIRRGEELLSDLAGLPVEIHRQSVVWGIDGTCVAYSSPQGSARIEACALIIATGGREFVPAFPGWTLPGVMTLGAGQRLIKRHGVIPGESILLAGTGPLLWTLAATMLEHDARPLAILDFSRPSRWLPAVLQITSLRDRLRLGWHDLNAIRTHRIRYKFTRERLSAHGQGTLQSVSAGDLDLHADVLCVGFGFRPNIELFQLAGCELGFDDSLGGWIPHTGEDLQTTCAGVYAAGECGGIAGAEKALLEGELAALALASALDRRLAPEHAERLRWLRRRRQKELRFGRVFNKVCEPPASFLSAIDHDVILCRCENVRASEVRNAISSGVTSLDGLKNQLRVGQGMCQGRTCGPLIQQTLSEALNLPEARFSPFHVRPPAKPVALDQIERLP